VIDVRCPQCNSNDLEIIDTQGHIKDAYISEKTGCLKCGHVFDVEAKIFYKKIGEKNG